MNSKVSFVSGVGSNLRFESPTNWTTEDRAALINGLRARYALLSFIAIVPDDPEDPTTLVITPPATLAEWQTLRSEALAVPLRLHPDAEVRAWVESLS